MRPGRRCLPQRVDLILAGIGLVVLGVACSGDPSGPSSGGCEVIYITSQSDPDATTGIQIENRLDVGLSATVGSQQYADAGADMAPGACEVWGYPSGFYSVALQRCEQAAGSSGCTSFIGSEVRRTISVDQGDRTRLIVSSGTFAN